MSGFVNKGLSFWQAEHPHFRQHYSGDQCLWIMGDEAFLYSETCAKTIPYLCSFPLDCQKDLSFFNSFSLLLHPQRSLALGGDGG